MTIPSDFAQVKLPQKSGSPDILRIEADLVTAKQQAELDELAAYSPSPATRNFLRNYGKSSNNRKRKISKPASNAALIGGTL